MGREAARREPADRGPAMRVRCQGVPGAVAACRLGLSPGHAGVRRPAEPGRLVRPARYGRRQAALGPGTARPRIESAGKGILARAGCATTRACWRSSPSGWIDTLRIASHPPWVTPVEELLRGSALQELEPSSVRLGLRQACESMPAHAAHPAGRLQVPARGPQGRGRRGCGPEHLDRSARRPRRARTCCSCRLKEAGESVLEPYLGKSHYANCC